MKTLEGLLAKTDIGEDNGKVRRNDWILSDDSVIPSRRSVQKWTKKSPFFSVSQGLFSKTLSSAIKKNQTGHCQNPVC